MNKHIRSHRLSILAGIGTAFLLLILSATLFAQSGASISEPFDTYGGISWKTEMFRLDNFYFALKSDPRSVGYISFYVGETDSYSKSKARATRARDYLVKKRNVSAKRIVVAYGGRLDRTTIVLRAISKNLNPANPEEKTRLLHPKRPDHPNSLFAPIRGRSQTNCYSAARSQNTTELPAFLSCTNSLNARTNGTRFSALFMLSYEF
jgi:hypothetical protein